MRVSSVKKKKKKKKELCPFCVTSSCQIRFSSQGVRDRRIVVPIAQAETTQNTTCENNGKKSWEAAVL